MNASLQGAAIGAGGQCIAQRILSQTACGGIGFGALGGEQLIEQVDKLDLGHVEHFGGGEDSGRHTSETGVSFGIFAMLFGLDVIVGDRGDQRVDRRRQVDDIDGQAIVHVVGQGCGDELHLALDAIGLLSNGHGQ